MRVALASILLALCAGAAPATKPATDATRPTTRPLIIRGGTLFDGTGAAPRPNRQIVIEEKGRIASLDDIGARLPAETFDATGLSILPGLIDLHVHFGAPTGADVNKPQALIVMDHMMNRPAVRATLLRHGVTSIRSVGDADDYILALKRRTAAGELVGPRIYTTGPLLTAPGGHPVSTIYRGNNWLIQHGARQLDKPEAARAQVRKLAEAGYDGIKCVYSDGGQRIGKMSLDVLRACIDEAHKQGMWAAVHAQTDDEVSDALAAGADTIEHGARRPYSNETAALLNDPRVTLVPTLAVIESFSGAPDRPWMRSSLDAVKVAHDSGVRIGAGTDTQGPRMSFGPSMHREIELLVLAGLTPVEALRCATGHAATALRAEADIGTVQRGRIGDLLLVEGEPWTDIADVRNVRVVIQGGKIVADLRTEHER